MEYWKKNTTQTKKVLKWSVSVMVELISLTRAIQPHYELHVAWETNRFDIVRKIISQTELKYQNELFDELYVFTTTQM